MPARCRCCRSSGGGCDCTILGKAPITVSGDGTTGFLIGLNQADPGLCQTIKDCSPTLTAGTNVTITGDATDGYTISATGGGGGGLDSVSGKKGVKATTVAGAATVELNAIGSGVDIIAGATDTDPITIKLNCDAVKACVGTIPDVEGSGLVNVSHEEGITYVSVTCADVKACVGPVGGQVASVVAGTNVLVDNTDPKNPIVEVPSIGITQVVDAGGINVWPDPLNAGKVGLELNCDKVKTCVGPVGTLDSVVAGTNVTINNTDPRNPIISATGGGGGGSVNTVKAAASQLATVDNTDPTNPLISVTCADVKTCVGDVGIVNSVVAGTNVTVDNSDPKNPKVSAANPGGKVDSVVAGSGIAVDSSDAANPKVSLSGTVVIAVQGDGKLVSVDSTNPAKPIVKVATPVVAGEGIIVTTNATTGVSTIAAAADCFGTVTLHAKSGTSYPVDLAAYTALSASVTFTINGDDTVVTPGASTTVNLDDGSLPWNITVKGGGLTGEYTAVIDVAPTADQVIETCPADEDACEIEGVDGVTVQCTDAGFQIGLNPAVAPAMSGMGWTTYNPTIDGITLGNGTISAQYAQVGPLVIVSITITAAAASPTTAWTSGSFYFPLPLTAAAGAPNPKGNAIFASPSLLYAGVSSLSTVLRGTVFAFADTAASGKLTQPRTSSVWTWGASANLNITFIYVTDGTPITPALLAAEAARADTKGTESA